MAVEDTTRRNPQRRRDRGPRAATFQPPTDNSPLAASGAPVVSGAPAPGPAPAGSPPPAAHPASAAIPSTSPTPREPTDFEGLRAIADLDPAAVRAAMEAAMGGGAGPTRAGLQPGQRVNGRVSSVSTMTVMVDIGGKSDAVIDRIEIGEVRVGDRVEAFVHSIGGGELKLTRTPSGAAAREMLREAMTAKMRVEGRIAGVSESGWQVSLSGGTRAFCPASHTGAITVDDPEQVGRSLPFLVHDLRGSDVVVSRREIVEAEEEAEAAERLGAIREGEVHEGTVVSLREFGAFVRLSNGVEGLVHNSNLADPRPKQASDVVKEGQTVRVRVLGIDRARRRVDLGMKQSGEMSSAPSSAGGLPSSQGRGFDVFAGLLKDVKVKR